MGIKKDTSSQKKKKFILFDKLTNGI